ncbi:MAG: translation initiation factor IF-2 [Proteobacteria bacterium]|nr:MAG: translation initiation factor IF-2 [Pseudomonadota bacterium]PIE18889.1 MAG: translation initiation factor IF-2 [Pseudomonadota bacterium]
MHGRQSFTNGESRERVRLYEVAKEIGLPNKDLLAKVRSMGIEVKNHMSSMDVDDVARVKRALEKERIENREVKRISATVIRRRSKGGKARPVKPAEGRAPTATAAEAAAELSRAAASVAPMPMRPQEERVAPPADPPKPEPAPEPTPAPPPAAPATVEPNVEQPLEAKDSEPAAAVPTEPPAVEAAVVAEVAPPVDPAPPAKAAPTPVAESVGETVASGEEAKPEPTTKSEPAQEKPPRAKAAEAQPSPPAAIEAKPVEAEKKEPEEPINLDDLPINSPLRRKAELAAHKREIRFAPGFEPGAQRPPRPPRGPSARATTASEAQPLSAADALKMLTPSAPRRPRVVITDLDQRNRRPSGPGGGRGGYRGGRRVKRKQQGKGKRTEITTPAEHKRVIRVEGAISVGEIARQMGVKSTQVLRQLWAMGMSNVMITHSIDVETASLLASEFNYEVEDVAFKETDIITEVEDKEEDLRPRSPVVTVMGHVDHGKTSLLDAIRGSDVVAGEAGGITQHIGAYRVNTAKGEVVFLDTPGHAAFTAMRARGAQCTDIVVLVVAADDGVMPQTQEAIEHAKDAGVPIVVAVNKIDRPDANPERVLGELSERGLVAESWGGDTIVVPTSAITKDGIDDLLESLILTSELQELTANPDKLAKGTVVEARMDKARGAMCTVLVQEGTLRVGDTVVVGAHLGKVRAMLDDRGNSIEEAGPSTPVELLGLGGVPDAGDTLNAVADDKAARTLADHRRNQNRQKEIVNASSKTSIEDLLSGLQAGDLKEMKLLIKADVQGSSEAIKESLAKLSTDKVEVKVISAGVGGIHETDINLASSSGAVILGFNVRTAGKASSLAEREGVEVRTYDVIYELLDDVKDLMRGLLPKERKEKPIGRAEVRQTFTIPKIGTIAGCAVVDGKIVRNSHLRLVRDNVKIYDGKVSSLRRFKEDVKEVQQGYECGIGIEGYNQLQEGDIIEAYEIEEVTPEL